MEFNRCMGCMEEISPDLDVCHCGYIKGTPAKEIYHLEPETILAGRYIVGKVLGFGGFGITYIGWDLEMDRKVAIKEYLPKDFATRFKGQTMVSVFAGEATEQFDAGLHSFVDEAKRLAQFNSVNGIVHIFDSFIENSTAYIVMEFLDGESLKDLVIRKGKISYDEAIGYIIPVLRELEQVHKVGIIHRDIAPDNIFLTNDGMVKLIDFGASKYATSLHSKSLSVILKPGYAPEEQYRSRGNQGPWTDIYAISATLYRLITGKVPVESLQRLDTNDPNNILKRPSELGVNIPENVEVAIMNGLNVYAENRYQTAKEFADVLEGLVPAKRKEEKIENDLPKPFPLWAKLSMIGGVVLSVAILIVLLSTGTLQKITAERLPNVQEMSIEQAAEVLLPYGYVYSTDDSDTEITNRIRIMDTIYDMAIPENMILSQDPNGGEKVNIKKNPDIYLILSGGARVVYLPDTSFVGMEQAEAVAQIETLGLVVNITEAESDQYAKGYVCAQDKEPGSELKEGDDITLTVSIGNPDGEKAETTVPNVVGEKQANAKKILGDAQLFVIVDTEYSNTVPAGKVISQNPKQGSKATTNETKVTIVVSKGAKADETTRVPDVTYRRQSNAISLLKDAGLNYKVVEEYSNNVARGTVIRQSIPEGREVKIGTTVTITVSKGAKNDTNAQIQQATSTTTTTTKPTTTKSTDTRPTVANVVGKTETNAKTSLKDFNVSVTYGYCDSVAKGKVISQNPKGNTKAKEGSTVTIVVSVGSKDSNWSEWSKTKPTGDVVIEQQTKYRTKTRTTKATSSSNPPSAGYQQYDTKTTYGAWSSAKTTTTKPTATETLRITNTSTKYKYYHYCNYYSGHWNIDSIKYGSQSHYHETTLNYTLPAYNMADQGNKQAYGGTGSGAPACAYNFYVWFYGGSTTTYTYQTRTKTTTYYYEKWSDWSSWSLTPATANDNLKVETLTTYRSRPNYKTYDKNGNVIS